MAVQHFLTLCDLSATELNHLIQRAIELKHKQKAGQLHQPLQGKTLAMIFEKASTRTRVSFEVGMAQLGGHALYLTSSTTQLGRGEPIADTARVLSEMVDGIMVRNDSHSALEELAEHASVPVINGLTDFDHPCQILADIQTYVETRGSIQGRKVVWVGDGNNVCQSWINAAVPFDFQLSIAAPEGYQPALSDTGRAHVEITTDPQQAVQDADLVVTDVWTSMGQEEEAKRRLQDLADYQVNAALMANAKNDALFMHCLPAHRGEEVTAEVIDGPQSVVWAEAGNRLHAQKALLEYLLAS